MTPEILNLIEKDLHLDSRSKLEQVCESLAAALRTAWEERDKLNVLLDERADKTDALLADHAMREASLLAERDARPDAATVAEVVELLHSIEDGPMSNAAAKLLVQALRLLEKP